MKNFTRRKTQYCSRRDIPLCQFRVFSERKAVVLCRLANSLLKHRQLYLTINIFDKYFDPLYKKCLVKGIVIN